MGKSPAKWIKTVLFGKKSSKSSFSKGTTIQEKASLTAKSQTGDLALNPPLITDQTRQITGIRGENELEKGTSMDMDEVLPASINENISIGLIPVDEHELAKFEEAATKTQAAFRGYLARRAFRALKGIIRLQALVRGHLVRRQAVATLRCMQSIIKLQSLVRGRKVRVSDIGLQVLKKDSLVDFVGVAKFVRAEKLSRNVFVTKLVASLPNAMPLSLQYDVVEPNSVDIWLERWSISCFWEPLPRQKKIVDPKPKRKQPNNIHTEDSDKPKRGIWKVQTKLNDTNSESEKPKRIPRKVPVPPTEPDPPQIELEKVKRNLRKVSVSAAAASEKPEPAVPEKPLVSLKKVSTTSPTHDLTEKPKLKPTVPAVIENTPEEKPLEDVVVINENLTEPTTEIPSQEVNGKVNSGPIESEPVAAKEENGSSGKENLKTRRRRSLPVKAELTESVPQSGPAVPSYMAATESAKAKLRAQETLRLAEEGIENGSVRRYSLPTSGNGKMNTPSPRMQKPLVNGKSGGNKSGRLVVSAAKDGWKR